MKNREPIFAIQQRMPLSRFEIKYYLKRLLGTSDCSDQLVETVLNRDIYLMWEGIDILGEFCDSTGVAPFLLERTLFFLEYRSYVRVGIVELGRIKQVALRKKNEEY